MESKSKAISSTGQCTKKRSCKKTLDLVPNEPVDMSLLENETVASKAGKEFAMSRLKSSVATFKEYARKIKDPEYAEFFKK